MLHRNSQDGFTLLEIVIVLAISSALALIALVGQTQIRAHAQFSNTIEQTRNSLMRVKNEANTTVNTGGNGTGGGSGLQFFAKRVIFADNSSDIKVETLLINQNNLITGPFDTYSIPMAGGVVFKDNAPPPSTSRKILFVRWPANGELYTFTAPLAGFNDMSFASYNPTVNAVRDSKDYQLYDPIYNFSATVSVNGLEDTINRTFN